MAFAFRVSDAADDDGFRMVNIVNFSEFVIIIG